MSIRKREGNRPDRRIAPLGVISEEARATLEKRLTYVGSGNHKLRPGDYGLVPSHNPRPSKSPCDDLRSVLLEEAAALFGQGIELGMVSKPGDNGVPKYVWAVDDDGEVYEAKTKPERESEYHGYRLGDDERAMKRYVTEEWKARCPKR
ncbi:MAG: hypothetical protein HZB28_08750 [Methylocystis sp.]|nr:hypothetical protein [Methylocystis sp.]